MDIFRFFLFQPCNFSLKKIFLVLCLDGAVFAGRHRIGCGGNKMIAGMGYRKKLAAINENNKEKDLCFRVVQLV
jgi:hypothetical protein